MKLSNKSLEIDSPFFGGVAKMTAEITSLELDGDHFLLKRGDETLARLTFDEVLALANSAPAYRQFIMAQKYPETGAVFATQVHDVAATWDALGENVLIQFGMTPDGSVVYQLSPSVFEGLLDRLQWMHRERAEISPLQH
jgi:hypothetical protein